MSLLSVRNLGVRFGTGPGSVAAVNDVSFALEKGERAALVGESGSGKSVTALAIMGLLERQGTTLSGSVAFDDVALDQKSARERRSLRGGRMAMVFQDPLTSLNPYLTVGEQILEAVTRHQHLRGRAGREEVVRLLTEVGMPSPAQRATAWPHELSGGQRQRVLIAMALAGQPELLIADEPTTALDVTVQAKILELLRTLCAQRGMGLLMITHDLGVVATVAERVLVLYAGRVMEDGPTTTMLRKPAHPYTRSLLLAVPRLDRKARTGLVSIPGQPPDPRHPVTGCPFHPRCALAAPSCAVEVPEFEIRDTNHGVACPITEDAP